jgi:hypothetical protein
MMRMCRLVAAMGAAALLVGGSRIASGQSAPDSARCDSIVAASRVDSVATALFISVERREIGLDSDDEVLMLNELGSRFVPPVPFRMSVFEGPELMNALRLRGGDTVPQPRPPTVTGTYRIAATPDGKLAGVRTIRESLVRGFDSAATRAIEASTSNPAFIPALDTSDSMYIDVRIASDSVSGARRLFSATFPRMPVVDVVPRLGNPAPAFPEDEQRDSVTSGEALVRFVVDHHGMPILSTVEDVRSSSISFLRAALAVLSAQRFIPASVRGCPVAQQVDYLFSFAVPRSQH